MADLSAPVGALLEMFGPMLRVAFGAVMRTALGMTLLVSCVCFASAYVAYGDGGSFWRALLAGVFGLVLGVVFTGMLAVKRAVGGALLHGLGRLQVGRRLLEVSFDKLRIANVAERVPLKQAEERLNGVVRGMLGELSGAGFLRRKIIETLMEKIGAVTLREFRSEANQDGGVDLSKVRATLEPRIDGAIADMVGGTLQRTTVAIVLAFSLLSLTVALMLRGLPG